MSILHCRDLDAGYVRANPCVRGLDLTIAAGEVIALLGPNGAGKTTLLTTLAGLLPRLGGSVTLDDDALRSGNPRAAVSGGMVLVPDDRALFRKMSCDRNLRLATKARGSKARAEIEEVLKHFPALVARLKVNAGQLSGGEQQMLAISRALLQRPRVLLIDELSMGLAPVVVESILPVVRAVAEDRGTAVVLVEQHVRLALEVADRAVVLVHGRIALEEDASTLAADIGQIERAYLGESADRSVS